jgi:hypothetical protein
MKNLEVLNLDSREIGDDGLRYLRHLPLKSLDLFSGRVTDLGYAVSNELLSFHSYSSLLISLLSLLSCLQTVVLTYPKSRLSPLSSYVVAESRTSAVLIWRPSTI